MCNTNVNRKVDLSKCPTKNGHISWKECVGLELQYQYNDKSGVIKIVEYINCDTLVVEHNNKRYNIMPDNIRKAQIGRIIEYKNYDYIYEIEKTYQIGDFAFKINDRFIKKDIKGRGRRFYKYTCLKCGAILEKWENSFEYGYGCPVCHNVICYPGINDITIKAPWMIQYFPGGYEQARNYTPQSNERVQLICPICGRRSNKKRLISDLYNDHSIGCACDNSLTFPELVMFNLLSQFNVNFIIHANKNVITWANSYVYDFYIPDYSMIIETHGLQHYIEVPHFKTTLKERQIIDKNKEDLAIKNHIMNYIIVDCRKSDLEFILHSCINSGLLNILNIDFNKIDINRLYYKQKDKRLQKFMQYIQNNPYAKQIQVINDLKLNGHNELNKLCKLCGVKIPKSGIYLNLVSLKDDSIIKSFSSLSEAYQYSIGMPWFIGTYQTIKKYMDNGKIINLEYRYIEYQPKIQYINGTLLTQGEIVEV